MLTPLPKRTDARIQHLVDGTCGAEGPAFVEHERQALAVEVQRLRKLLVDLVDIAATEWLGELYGGDELRARIKAEDLK